MNVSAHLLWPPDPGGLSFDISRYNREFISYIDDAQFAPLAERLAQMAAEELTSLTSELKAPSNVLAYMTEENRSSRQAFHAGVALGLSGRGAEAADRFNRILAESVPYDWFRKMQAAARKGLNCVTDTIAFRAFVTELIARQRAALKLPALPDPLQDAA